MSLEEILNLGRVLGATSIENWSIAIEVLEIDPSPDLLILGEFLRRGPNAQAFKGLVNLSLACTFQELVLLVRPGGIRVICGGLSGRA